MNTVITSREAILEASRHLVLEHGFGAVNMRSVAAACQVSVGSIYYYFRSKLELIGATVESVWREIFDMPMESESLISFIECVERLFKNIEEGMQRYPGFLSVHSVSFVGENKAKGLVLMKHSLDHIHQNLQSVLLQDKNLRSNAFSEQFSVCDFENLIFSLIISNLLRGEHNKSSILELIRRCIY